MTRVQPGPERTVLTVPRSAYLVVAFIAVCATAAVRAPWQLSIYLIPVACGYVIARRATIVDDTGLTVRAVFGESSVAWEDLSGVRLDNSGAVYAVDRQRGELRLPCVRATNLAPLIHASAGRIPDPSAPAQ